VKINPATNGLTQYIEVDRMLRILIPEAAFRIDFWQFESPKRVNLIMVKPVRVCRTIVVKVNQL